MDNTIKNTFNPYILGVPLLMMATLILFVKLMGVSDRGNVDFAVTADLLLTIPLVYFLLIRKTEIPKTTVVPVMIIGFLAGSYLLPKEGQTYLALFKNWALPVIEIGVFTFVVIKVRSAIKKFTYLKGSTPDFFTVLKKVSSEILPKRMAMPFATEVGVMYYGFVNWRSYQLKENEFAYHRKSGTPALLGAFILIIFVEVVAVHFLLAQWSHTAAWVLTGLSLYTAVQVLGATKSLSRRPIVIKEDFLILKYGILSEVEIPLVDIREVELSNKKFPETEDLSVKLSPLGELENHNLIIHLESKAILTGMYGRKKPFTKIGFQVDLPAEFKERLDVMMINNLHQDY